MYLIRILTVISILHLLSATLWAETIRVPDDQPTVQAAVFHAQQGDTVLVSPGVYAENVVVKGKAITLASLFLDSSDTSYVSQTVLDGQGEAVLVIEGAGPGARVIGLTIQNGDDGISTDSRIEVLHNRFLGNKDAIDYESGGGICRGNLFENNRDDAVDLDGASEVTIEDNIIRNNNDDGIEIRLHPYSGSYLQVVIRNNWIVGNGEDGIQFIDYGGQTSRVFWIERNVIANSVMAGVGCMGNQNTRENYEAASIPESIVIVNNTFWGNAYGITGGDNLVALNNIFVKTEKTALKEVNGGSIAAYNLFWMNGFDQEGSNWQQETMVFQDPGLDSSYRPAADSPSIDAGTRSFSWQDWQVFSASMGSFAGMAPDLGAFEFGQADGDVVPVRGLIRLKDPLDEPGYYCVDVPGFRDRVNLDAPLMGHTCKPGAEDEMFTIHYPSPGQIYMEAYDRCVQAERAESGAELYLQNCSDSPLQKFVFTEDGQIRLQAGSGDLCWTIAAGEGTPTGGPSHLRRDLLIQKYSDVDPTHLFWMLPEAE